MGFGGISIWQLLIVLAIILLLFGGKRLRSLGGDLGTAIKGFKTSIKDETSGESEAKDNGQDAINVKATVKDDSKSNNNS